ncbi:MAG TPA: tRNA (guanosine(46)-N7)-methyltransferase TrmB [Propionibacteriaceae bacterium]|nr:tRNA (guanosine(46)-N7)-methyltransferase TrmB [Propionibacteriaceae bacterium]
MVVRGEARPHRDVVSFVRRSARMNPSQEKAWRHHRATYVVDVAHGPMSTSVAPQEPVDWAQVFGRTAPLLVEIGVGNGDSLVATAAAHPDVDVIGFEVFEPSMASTVGKLASQGLTNARLVLADGVQGLRWLVAPASLDAVHVFFPDPWHKARHHKRRLVSPATCALVADRLRPGGLFRLATDWEDYALAMREVLDASSLTPVHEGWGPRFEERPMTKYEMRGVAAGRTVYDLCYRR